MRERNHFTQLEYEEIIDKLIDNGFAELINILYYEDAPGGNKVYTKRGRLNKSGACRALNCKTKDLEATLKECQRILGEELMNP